MSGFLVAPATDVIFAQPHTSHTPIITYPRSLLPENWRDSIRSLKERQKKQKRNV